MNNMRNKILSLLVLLLTAATGAWAEEATITLKCGTTEKTYENVTLPWSTTADILEAVITDLNFNVNINAISGGDGKVVKYGNENFTVTGTFSGEATVTVTYNMGSSATITVTAPRPLMTLNEAKTVATMESMPAFDATVEYELVRDMGVQMTAQVGDGTQEQPRYRVKKDGNKFIPADMEMAAVPALFTVNDAIEQKALTQTQDYIVQIYAIDAEGQPTGQPMTFATFTFEPGIYAVKAVAAQGSDYDGETALSNTFKLFQGYEITVPAGEFATFYKDEPLGLGEEHYTAGAALYTITDVNGTTATATELEITTDEPPLAQVAPAYTPLLVYNGSDEDMRVLLIPTTSSATVSHFSGFTGSLESQTLWGGEGFYACNGKQFVYVKNDLTLPANKCCLKITSGNSFEQGSRSITIVFDDATGISHEAYKSYETYDWYDLNGRKLNGMPTKKGVYILNGKKVVVK